MVAQAYIVINISSRYHPRIYVLQRSRKAGINFFKRYNPRLYWRLGQIDIGFLVIPYFSDTNKIGSYLINAQI